MGLRPIPPYYNKGVVRAAGLCGRQRTGEHLFSDKMIGSFACKNSKFHGFIIRV